MAGYFQLFVARLHVGDTGSAEEALAAGTRLAEELRQPSQLWQVHAASAMIALAAGRFTEAQELMARTLALGDRAQRGMAIPAYTVQSYTLADFQGRLQKIEAMLGDAVGEYRTWPILRCALAHLHIRLGHNADARRIPDDLAANDFSSLPVDIEWLYSISMLAETCARLGAADVAAVLYDLLAPHAAFNAADTPEGLSGAVSRYLGLVAATMFRWDDAAMHLDAALGMNERMGFRPWVAHTQYDYARTLLARNEYGDRAQALELINDAITTYRALDMRTWADEACKVEQQLRIAPASAQ